MKPLEFPRGLLSLINGRSKFAKLWKDAGKYGAWSDLAVALAEMAWPVEQIAGALAHHESQKVSQSQALVLAKEAVLARLEAMKPPKDEERLPSAKIVKVYEQRPRTFQVIVGEATFVASAHDLTSSAAFMAACLAQTAVVPEAIPKAKWRTWLDKQIAQAERVALPEEASEEGHEQAVIESMLESAPRGTDMRQTMMGHRVIVGGDQFIHGPTMLTEARRALPKLTSERFYRYLRDIGWSPDQHAGPTRQRHWVAAYNGTPMLSYDERMEMIKQEREADEAQQEEENKPFFDD